MGPRALQSSVIDSESCAGFVSAACRRTIGLLLLILPFSNPTLYETFAISTGFSGAVSSVIPATISAAADPLSKQEIAERVESTFRNAKYLEVTTFSFRGPAAGFEDVVGPIVGVTKLTITRSWMTVNAFRTEARDENEKLLMAFSLYEGRFQEFHPNLPLRPLLEIDSLYPHAVEDVVHEKDLACLFGGHTMSWVGVPADNKFPQAYDYARSMRAKIEFGTQQPDAIEIGRVCYVFRYSASPDLESVVYVDKETFLVVRWDTINAGVHGVRVNHFRQIGDRVPENTDWKIEPEALADKG